MTIWDYIASQQENREKASDWKNWKLHYAEELFDENLQDIEFITREKSHVRGR